MSPNTLPAPQLELTEYYGCYNGLTNKDYTEYLKKLHAIKKAKFHFVETGEILPIVRSPIAESWKSCVEFGLNVDQTVPYKTVPPLEFKQLCHRNKFLIDVAYSVFKTICSTFNNVDFCLQLFDDTGCLLHSRNAFQNENKEIRNLPEFELGYRLNNNIVMGSVSLALKYKENFSVYGPEHFYSAFDNLNCDSVLIHSNDGVIIGVINVLYYVETINTLIPSIAATVVELIEQQFIKERYSSIANQTLDYISEGALIVDSSLNVIKANRIFFNILNIKEDELPKINVRTLFNEVDFDKIIYSTESHITFNEILICYNSNFTRINMNMSAIYSGNYFDGFIILCREIKEIIKLSQKFTCSPLFNFSNIITQDKVMAGLIRDCNKIASLDIPVLIEGASGTGKELFAQSIHSASSRKDKPFVAVNCAALPVNLVESELFGYEKGAFTGALSTGKAGKFEQADGGTIFLDEVGELPLDIQAKLLRVLDNYKLSRMGGNTEKTLNIRVVAATNRDLYNQVKLKSFREDLYYRLNVMNFHLPSLKYRYGDIPLLTKHFLENLNRRNLGTKQMSEDTMDTLNSREWVGNVRELQNAITHAYHLCENNLITREFLPTSIACENSMLSSKTTPVLKPSMQSIQRNMIVEALQDCNGNIKEAAVQLDIPLSTLYKKIKLFDIKSISKLYS